jgi:hypothetical protein
MPRTLVACRDEGRDVDGAAIMMTTARVSLSGTWTAPALRAVAAGLILAFAFPASPDVLVLKDGKTVEGEIRETDAAYEVKTPFGTLTVTKADVARRVPPADAVAAEAETLRTVAKGMIEEAGGLADTKARDRKLAAAAEILGKAANLLVDARSIYPGDAYAHLDKAAAELLGEARRCRERMAPADMPPAQPVKPTPPAVPVSGAPAPVPAAPVPAVDILAPPPPPKAHPAPAEESRAEHPPADPVAPISPVPVPTPASAAPADKLLADARKMADAKRATEARTIAARLLKQYPDTPAAEEAQTLLNTLPHPDGRLVSGFDTEADLKAWHVYRPRLVKLAPVAEPKEIYEGKGAARMTVTRDTDHTTGAIILELGKFDETRFRGLSLWIYQAQPSPGRLEVAFIRGKQESLTWVSEEGDSEIGACLYWATPLNFTGWRQFKVSAQQFLPRGSGGVSGKITWRDVGAVVIYDAARKGMDVVLDSLRFIELEK